jgi:hypothetical protein
MSNENDQGKLPEGNSLTRIHEDIRRLHENPFVGQTLYAYPRDKHIKLAHELKDSNPVLADAVQLVGSQPMAVWIENPEDPE